MDVRVLWTRRAVKFLNLTIRKIDGKKNCADVGTKSHSAGEHKRLCEMNYLMSEEDVKRPPTAEVNAVTASGRSSVKTALIALLTALIAEQSRAQEDCLVTRSSIASDLVDTSREFSMRTIRDFTFEFWLIALGLLIVIVLLACLIALGWKILHELRALARAMPKAREPNCDSRTVLCQSQATYQWWQNKPEFRALPPRSHGCWTD
jgi:hypothetical protein